MNGQLAWREIPSDDAAEFTSTAEHASHLSAFLGCFKCSGTSDVWRKIVGDMLPHTMAPAVEAFAVVSGSFEGFELVFQLGQELVELLVVRPMYVVRELW